MAFSRDVIIRLPGPNRGGDTWGDQWTEPGAVSPGHIEVQAKAVRSFPNEDLLVELDGRQRRFTPDDGLTADYTFKFVGKVNNTELASIRSSLQTLLSDPDNTISSTARTIRKIIRNDVDLSDAQQLMGIANNAGRKTDVRLNSLLLVAIILTNEL